MTFYAYLLNRSRFPAICAVAVLAAVLPSYGADSEFSDLPPTPSSAASKYSPDLPSDVPSKPAANTTPAAPPAAKTNTEAGTSKGSEFSDLPQTPSSSASRYSADLPPTVPATPAVRAAPATPSAAKTNTEAGTSKGSEFSGLPQTPSSAASRYSPDLPPAVPVTPAVKTAPAALTAAKTKDVADTSPGSEFAGLSPASSSSASEYSPDLPPSMPAMPALRTALVAPSAAKINTVADTSTDISTNTPNVPLNTPINGMDGLDDSYRLASGDTINYQVVEDEDDVKTLPVTDSGDIEVPYLGRFPARGKTCKELAEQLKVELQKKYYYQATVIISVNSKASQGVVYLVGGVRSPGPLEMPRDDVLTVSKAILRAGGIDDFGDGAHIRITRQTESGTNIVFTVNYSAIVNKGKTKDDLQVEPGDLIFVPEKTFRF